MLGTRGYKAYQHLPRHSRAEFLLAFFEKDDEKLPEINRERATPVARQGIDYPSGSYPPIGGNPRRQTETSPTASRPQAVPAQVLDEADRRAERARLLRARQLASEERYHRARRMTSDPPHRVENLPIRENSTLDERPDELTSSSGLAGEEVIRRVEELDELPERYFKELTEARV